MIINKKTDIYNAALRMTNSCIVTIDCKGFILSFESYMDDIPEKLSYTFEGHDWFDVFKPMQNEIDFHNFLNPESIYNKETDEIHNLLTCYKEKIFVEWNFMKIMGPDNKPLRFIGSGQNVSNHIQIEKKLLHEKSSLIEKNKELKCLYGIAKIFGNTDLTLDEILQSVSDLLPKAFEFPDFVVSHIELDGRSYAGAKNIKPGHTISEQLEIFGMNRGKVEVTYPLRYINGCDETLVFHKVEHQLLKTVAQQLSMFIKKRELIQKHSELERQLHHADRLATVGQLAAGIAHELNGPLNNILGFAELSAKQQDLPEQVYLDLDDIVRFTLYAREIVKKVMLFSRQMPPKHEHVDLNKIISESLYFTEPLCSKAGIHVDCDLSGDLPAIMADSAQLHQVVVNLIVNAAQAMPENGGSINIRTSLEPENTIRLRIVDSGSGMSQETLDQCFIPFFTTKDVDQGTGLGLSVVHGIIEAHEGTIKANSQKGKGSRFDITFPVTAKREETYE